MKIISNKKNHKLAAPRLVALESSPTGWQAQISDEERDVFQRQDDFSLGEQLFRYGLRSASFPETLDIMQYSAAGI